MQAQGVVKKIMDPKPSGAQAFCVALPEGDEWFGLYKETANFAEGQVIAFPYTVKGTFKNVKIADVAVIGTAASAAAQATVAQSAPPKAAAPANNSYMDKDNSILHQSCRKDAIAVVTGLVAADKVALPAKKGDAQDAALALVDELTARFFIQTRKVVADGGIADEEIISEPNDELPDFS